MIIRRIHEDKCYKLHLGGIWKLRLTAYLHFLVFGKPLIGVLIALEAVKKPLNKKVVAMLLFN